MCALKQKGKDASTNSVGYDVYRKTIARPEDKMEFLRTVSKGSKSEETAALVQVYTNERPDNPSPVRQKTPNKNEQARPIPKRRNSTAESKQTKIPSTAQQICTLKQGKVKQKLSSVVCLGVVDLSSRKSVIF
jgi:hypothetical protein